MSLPPSIRRGLSPPSFTNAAELNAKPLDITDAVPLRRLSGRFHGGVMGMLQKSHLLGGEGIRAFNWSRVIFNLLIYRPITVVLSGTFSFS